MKFTPKTNAPTKTQYNIFDMDNDYMYSTFDGKIAAGEHHMNNKVQTIEVDLMKKHPNKITACGSYS